MRDASRRFARVHPVEAAGTGSDVGRALQMLAHRLAAIEQLAAVAVVRELLLELARPDMNPASVARMWAAIETTCTDDGCAELARMIAPRLIAERPRGRA